MLVIITLLLFNSVIKIYRFGVIRLPIANKYNCNTHVRIWKNLWSQVMSNQTKLEGTIQYGGYGKSGSIIVQRL